MKKFILVLMLIAATAAVRAQFQANPQFGLNYQRMTSPGIPGLEYKAGVGWQLGLDLRFGDRMYFQPGVFYGRSATVIKGTYNDTLTFQDDLVRTNLKLRTMLGYRIIDTWEFDVRFAMGPSYDVLLSVDNRNDPIAYDQGDFRRGSLNMDAALGFDMGYLTVEPSVSFGLSRVFTEQPVIGNIASRYMTYGLTVGINIGNDDK